MVSTVGDTGAINIVLILFNTGTFFTDEFNLRQLVHSILIGLLVRVYQILGTVLVCHPVFLLHDSIPWTDPVFSINWCSFTCFVIASLLMAKGCFFLRVSGWATIFYPLFLTIFLGSILCAVLALYLCSSLSIGSC